MLQWRRPLLWTFTIILCQALVSLPWLVVPPLEVLGRPALSFLLNCIIEEWLTLLWFFASCWLVHATTILVLTAPFYFLWRAKMFFPLALVAVVNFFWILRHAVESPTLFMDSLFVDSIPLTRELVIWLASHGGPLATLLLLACAFVLVAAKFRHQKKIVAGLLSYYAAMGFFLFGQPEDGNLRVPSGSIIMFIADSLRADHVNESTTPLLLQAASKFQAKVLKNVVPVSSRTAVSIAALLTGRMPEQTGVTNMFGTPGVFDRRQSMISDFQHRGYCTLAVTEYPGDFLVRDDYGFEILDAPTLNWDTNLSQIFLKRDPFLLATISHSRVRRLIPRKIRNAFIASMSFSDPEYLAQSWQEQLARCGDRPVFALLFSTVTHLPYIQRWPFYVKPDLQHFTSAAVGQYTWDRSSPLPERREAHEWLYRNAAQAFDAAAAGLIEDFFSNKENLTSTLIVTSDHGEYLYDRIDISGHGDQIGHLDGLKVPWIVFGSRKNDFNFEGDLVSNLWLHGRLTKSYRAEKPIDSGAVYTETGVWFDPDVAPKDRLPYPGGPDLFEVDSKSRYIIIKDEYLEVVELGKFRTWFIKGHRIDLSPGRSKTRLSIDGEATELKDIPKEIRPTVSHYLERIEALRKKMAGVNL